MNRKITILILSFATLILSYLWVRQTNWGEWEAIISFIATCLTILGYGGLSKEAYKLLQKTLKDYNIEYAFWALIISIGVALMLWMTGAMETHKDDPWGGIMVEFHGMLFDIVILSIGLGIYETLKQRKENERREQELRIQRIEKYKEEIDDFRHWKSDEAKFRIRGNIYRLNKENETKLDLAFIDLSNLELRKISIAHSNLCETNFSYSNMENSNFEEIICSGSKFNGKDAFLLNANFKNAHLQYSEFIGAYLGSADFSNAKLSNINFSKADIRGIVFQNAYLYEPNFEGAEVSYDFMAKLPDWKIEGYSIASNYHVVKSPVLGHPGHFQYFFAKNRIKNTEQCMVSYAVQSPTRKANPRAAQAASQPLNDTL